MHSGTISRKSWIRQSRCAAGKPRNTTSRSWPSFATQALVLEEVQAQMVALQQLLEEIREEQHLAWDRYEELR